MRLADAYHEHKWQLQLTAWALLVLLLSLLLIRQCHQSRDDLPSCSAAMSDSLQQLALDSCQRLDYKGFTIYFDAKHHLARCAIYELTADETRGTVPRAKKFVQDPLVDGCPDPKAYAGSGLERGHIVPAGDLKWDSVAMRQSFMMTNICPQDKSLNEGGWNRLEVKAREWAVRDNALIIAAGPVLGPGLARTAGGVTIPRYYYKVILAHHARPMRAVAFVYPNAPSNGGLRQYAVTVDSVERLTGIDFFATLPDELENRIEARNDLASFLQLRK